MSINEIETLLDKYYEGETTLAEEKLLKEFFSGDDVPARLQQHQPLFRFFADEARQSSSETKQDEILIRRMAGYTVETRLETRPPLRKTMHYLSGIAAGLLILISLVFVIRNEVGNNRHEQIAEPTVEEAYTQTTQALLLVSVGLNTGFNAVEGLQTMGNALEQVQRINKFYNYQNQFINPERMQTPSINK